VEVGLSASISSFKTITPFTDINKGGIVFHIPFSLGLALGPKHNIDIAILYYVQPSIKQLAGMAAFGISVPLRN
jgi:hypothetical protein